MHSSQSTSLGQPFTGAGGTQSNAPRVPPGRLLRVVQGVLDVMFGAPDDDATATGLAGPSGQDNVQVELRPARTPRGELLLNALSQAIAEYHYTFLRPYRRYSPEFTFQLHQVCLVRTPDNMALLAEFDRLRREQRNVILKAKFKEFDGFDLSEFSDVRIEDEASGATDPVMVVAGEGALCARLGVEFHGEFVERAALPSPVATPSTRDQEPPAGRTSMPPSQTQTLIPRVRDAADAEVILLIKEPQHEERSVTVSQFPARLGRSEDCDVVINCGYVSRLHATVLQNPATGGFQLVDHSRVGTKLAGKPLNADTEVALANGAELALSSSAPGGGVGIRVELRQPTMVPPASQVATLIPRPVVHEGAGHAAASTVMDPPVGRRDDKAARPSLAEHSTANAGVPAARQLIARLRVRTSDGDTQLHDILELPFEIGREPEGANRCLIGEHHTKVSRQHLRLLRYQAGAFTVINLAHTSNGTWVRNERMPERFTLKPVAAGSADGWCLLGERDFGRRSAAIRLESAP